MKKILKWQQKIIEDVQKLPNDKLLEETLYLAGGDDYDGCFTKKGEFEYQILRDELRKRLIACNFLSKEIENI